MADFVPDGHKYGWRFSKPWGEGWRSNDPEHRLKFTKLRFQIEVDGASKTLGLDSYYCPNGPAFNFQASPRIFYFVLSYSNAGEVPYSETKLTSSPVGQSLNSNQFLVRLTVSATDSDYASCEGSVPKLFKDTADNMNEGNEYHISAASEPTTQYDFCFEFSADSSPQVQNFGVRFANFSDASAGGGNPPELTEESELYLYMDELEVLASGGCVFRNGSGIAAESYKSITLPVPSPMSCLYKDPSGALYQLDTSAYATQAEYQSLLARVAALEAAKAGA